MIRPRRRRARVAPPGGAPGWRYFLPLGVGALARGLGLAWSVWVLLHPLEYPPRLDWSGGPPGGGTRGPPGPP